MRKILISMCIAVSLVACDSDPGETLQESIDTGNVSNFDPANSVIPFPNDLLFQGSVDGTINIPVVDANDLADPQVALNGLDGFSTVAPFSTGFNSAIKSSSIGASSVRVFEVSLSSGAAPGGAVVAINAELTYGLDFVGSVSSVDPAGATLAIVPLRTLKPKTHYWVVVTKALQNTLGNSMLPSVSYALAKLSTALVDGGGVSQVPALDDATAAALEPLRQLISFSETTLVANASPALTADEITISWGFTTQSTVDVLTQVRTETNNTSPTLTFNPAPNAVPGVSADVYVGTLTVPYYLENASGVNDPTPLNSFWKGVSGSLLTSLGANPGCLPAGINVCPVPTSTENIPVMLSTPAGGCGVGVSCPVIIYQHGITTNRTTMLALADSMAAAGFAVIAIDMPMHGVTGNETDGTAGFKNPVSSGGERTFDLDLVTQDPLSGDIIAAIPDGVTDSSGRHFINLSNLQNSRDNVRQAVSDLFALRFALDAADYNAGAADGTFDTTNVKFIGHSLGGMVGTPFLALEPGVGDAVLAMAGGGIAKLLDGSAAFGPSIAAGLAVNGVNKGTPDYESFIGAVQTVVDSGDPINFATASTNAATGRGILFYEIVGGNGVPSDTVVPNRVPDSNDISNTVPGLLSGTDPLVGVDADIANTGLGLTQYNTSQAGPNLLALARYIAGDHSSLLSPASSLAVTTEMQTQAATFLASGSLSVTDTSVIAAP